MGPTATLFETLEAWRQDRSSVVLANQVDEAAAHVERVPAPGKLQRWWTDHARTYAPVIATTLLATLYTQAEAAHVSWRVIMLRETPLVDELRAAGFEVPSEAVRPRWLNLVDRLGLVLAWPDDPRAAVALAEALQSEAFVGEHARLRGMHRDPVTRALTAAVVKRVAQIGDLRALERVARHWRNLAPELVTLIVQAATSAPVPRHGDAVDDVAWQAVLEEPDALAPRLVLADAYMERGDPRGDMIALQCAPLVVIEEARATGEDVDASALFGAASDRTHALVRANWHRWLGEAALVVGHHSRFQGGLLHHVIAGHPATPPWAWERVAGHRELCAMHRLEPARGVELERFADFVAALVRKPRWLRITSDMLRVLRDRCGTLALPGIELHDVIGGLEAAADRALALSPHLERLAFGVSSLGPDIHTLAVRLPHVRLCITVDHVGDRAALGELPNLEIFSRDGS